MLELLIKSRPCPACGAGLAGTRRGGVASREGWGGTSFEASGADGLRRPTRERSGLAYASGFAGVFYLFRYSLAPLALSQPGQEWGFAAGLMLVWGLLAPAALALSFAAAVSLDRSPPKSGMLPALFGFFVGWHGVAAWLSQMDGRWLEYLLAF